MDPFDEILAQYEIPVLSEQEVQEIKEQADSHLHEYLVGDGNVQHLYDYYECLEKIN